MLASMTETAAQDGLDYHFDIAQHSNTFDAHRLLHLAAERGIQGELKERLFRATFTEGRAVGDPASLIDIAVEAGLDRDEVGDHWPATGMPPRYGPTRPRRVPTASPACRSS